MQEKRLIKPTFLRCSEKKTVLENLKKLSEKCWKILDLVGKSRHTTPLEKLVIVNQESISKFICNLNGPTCKN